MFGDGFFGKKLENNQTVTATYIVTDGLVEMNLQNLVFKELSVKMMELSLHHLIMLILPQQEMLLMVLKLKMYLLLSILLQDFIQHSIEQLHQETMKQ